MAISLFCQSPKNRGQTLILSLGVVACIDGISSEFRKVTEEGYIERYERHNAEVLEHFKDRSDDLLVLHLDRGVSGRELWKKLCHFLDKPVPNEKFPHTNSKKDRLIINHLRRLKHRAYGKEPINILGLTLGKKSSL